MRKQTKLGQVVEIFLTFLLLELETKKSEVVHFQVNKAEYSAYDATKGGH